MHLVLLTQYYPPETGAPQGRLSDLARRFGERGHRVTVLTAMPSYPRGVVYSGYGGALRRERRDGCEVIRTYAYPTQRAGLVPRLTNYLSFTVTSALVGVALLDAPDFLMVESPPLFLGLSGVWLSWAKRSRLIMNVSDLWPESAVRLGVVHRDSLAHRLSSRLEAYCYRRAWLVTGQSRGIVEDIARRYPTTRTYFLSNGVLTDRFRSADPGRGPDGDCVVLYAGLHGLAQGLHQVLDAAAALQPDERIRFVLVGDGPDKPRLVAEAARRRLGNITFRDPVPAEAIPDILASAQVALVTLKGDIPGAVPSKLYEAMASGRPVVLVAAGEPASILQQTGGGIVVAPGDAAGLATAIRSLCTHPASRREYGVRGRDAARRLYDRREIAARFIDHLEAAASK